MTLSLSSLTHPHTLSLSCYFSISFLYPLLSPLSSLSLCLSSFSPHLPPLTRSLSLALSLEVVGVRRHRCASASDARQLRCFQPRRLAAVPRPRGVERDEQQTLRCEGYAPCSRSLRKTNLARGVRYFIYSSVV